MHFFNRASHTTRCAGTAGGEGPHSSRHGFLWWGSPETDSRRGAEFVPGIQFKFNIPPPITVLTVFASTWTATSCTDTAIPRNLYLKGFISRRTGGHCNIQVLREPEAFEVIGLDELLVYYCGTFFYFPL